jgi:hypothetical protein
MPTAVIGGPKWVHPEATLRGALQSITSAIVFHAGDWSLYPREAWIYGITVGWGCEEEHEHDDICGGDGALTDMAEKHGWDSEQVERLRSYRVLYRTAEAHANAPSQPSGPPSG